MVAGHVAPVHLQADADWCRCNGQAVHLSIGYLVLPSLLPNPAIRVQCVCRLDDTPLSPNTHSSHDQLPIGVVIGSTGSFLRVQRPPCGGNTAVDTVLQARQIPGCRILCQRRILHG